MKLSKAILPLIGHHGVSVPKYDPSSVTPGILHFGVGNFHRSHLGYYLDELFNQASTDEERAWGVVGTSVRPDPTGRKRQVLADQDFLQTLVAREGDLSEARIIGSMVDYVTIDTEIDTSPIMRELLKPEIKIVSMTITEGGYFLNPNTGKFDPSLQAMQRDAQCLESPTTVFGLIVQALRLRRERGIPPFTVMSCDNLPHNGDVCREVTVGLANIVDDDLAKWIDEQGAFPNSMVDRIATQTTDREIEYVKTKYSLADNIPVFCEGFTQWVIEDNFCNGRPKFEDVGVTFTENVTPFETMKIRILNGGHASLCYAAALMGIKYVHEAMEHPVIGPYLHAIETTEIIPTVGEVPGVDLNEYWSTIKKRFSNYALEDTIKRNVPEGSDRQTKFVIPIVLANQEKDVSVKGLALVSALWCRYCQGKTEKGEEIEPNDNLWEQLNSKAMEAIDKPKVWLEMKNIYGEDLLSSEFVEHFTEALNMINKDGVEATLKKYTESTIGLSEDVTSAAAA